MIYIYINAFLSGVLVVTLFVTFRYSRVCSQLETELIATQRELAALHSLHAATQVSAAGYTKTPPAMWTSTSGTFVALYTTPPAPDEPEPPRPTKQQVDDAIRDLRRWYIELDEDE